MGSPSGVRVKGCVQLGLVIALIFFVFAGCELSLRSKGPSGRMTRGGYA